jgi:hypothetical protein
MFITEIADKKEENGEDTPSRDHGILSWLSIVLGHTTSSAKSVAFR